MNHTRLIVQRLLICCVLGLVFAVVISEGSYRLLRDDTDREPQTVNLLIPSGTAERVAAGESVETLPENMVFVTGDILVVTNEDRADHQLGPLWVPAGATASLALDQANKFSYGCSFQPSRYLGLDVRPRGASLQSRLLAVAFAGPPTIALLAVYSFLILPIRPRIIQQTGQSATEATPIKPDAGQRSPNGKTSV
jgi:hypothetical protein